MSELNRTRETIEVFDKQASSYESKFMHLDLYNETYDQFCALVQKQNAKILEIGCGPGNMTRYILSKRPDLNITAIDLAPNMITLAKENNPASEFLVMDARDINTLQEKFDAILCGFCLPYLSQEECGKLIADSAALLNDNGIIYLSVIDGDYKNSGYEYSSNGQYKCYVYYHEENELRNMLEKNQFSVSNVSRINYPKSETQNSTHLILHAKKK